ncbi:MAG: TetR/AcrR family transcriptional regulator [Proteobacteria bacterium]|nr:TetR/AcrR family transcriptional regulator [Pseudomonadota bacterium]
MDTREKLVRTAEKLMLRDGYSAMRVDDVIGKAGLSKGSFYHFFDSKESLGLAALEHYYADRVGRLADGAYASEADPLRRAHGFLEHASGVAADLWGTGCLLANLAADAAGSSRVISNALKKRTGDLRALLADMLGPFATPETGAADLAEQFIVCVEGAIVLARIYDDPAYIRRGLEAFGRRLESPRGSARPRAPRGARPAAGSGPGRD